MQLPRYTYCMILSIKVFRSEAYKRICQIHACYDWTRWRSRKELFFTLCTAAGCPLTAVASISTVLIFSSFDMHRNRIGTIRVALASASLSTPSAKLAWNPTRKLSPRVRSARFHFTTRLSSSNAPSPLVTRIDAPSMKVGHGTAMAKFAKLPSLFRFERT